MCAVPWRPGGLSELQNTWAGPTLHPIPKTGAGGRPVTPLPTTPFDLAEEAHPPQCLRNARRVQSHSELAGNEVPLLPAEWTEKPDRGPTRKPPAGAQGMNCRRAGQKLGTRSDHSGQPACCPHPGHARRPALAQDAYFYELPSSELSQACLSILVSCPHHHPQLPGLLPATPTPLLGRTLESGHPHPFHLLCSLPAHPPLLHAS